MAVYPDFDELVSDIAGAYRTVIRDLYAAGCRNLQFDDCTWGMIVDDDFWKSMAGMGFTLESEAGKYLRVNNLALEGRPADLVVTTHVCRGNYHSTYATRGAYDPVAPWLFAQEHVDAFYLEYDDERSGSFEPLAFIPADKKVVLGLVTTKSPVLEDPQAVIARIHEAERYVPLERLYLSPQCGFASCEMATSSPRTTSGPSSAWCRTSRIRCGARPRLTHQRGCGASGALPRSCASVPFVGHTSAGPCACLPGVAWFGSKENVFRVEAASPSTRIMLCFDPKHTSCPLLRRGSAVRTP